MSRSFVVRGRSLSLETPLIMGIHNATPDSFSDGGEHPGLDASLRHCVRMIEDGADIVDIGGESTRPGSDPVPVEVELLRVAPLVAALRKAKPDCVISVDTSKIEVARETIAAGADIINDVTGLKGSGGSIAKLCAETGAGLVLMHMRGDPKSMQVNLVYDDLLVEVLECLVDAAMIATSAGVSSSSIMIDPGIGFGKSIEQNLELIANIAFFKTPGFPVLIGPSRKSFIGRLLDGAPPEGRLYGTIGACLRAVAAGADALRVHDVKEVAQSLKVFSAMCKRVSPTPVYA